MRLIAAERSAIVPRLAEHFPKTLFRQVRRVHIIVIFGNPLPDKLHRGLIDGPVCLGVKGDNFMPTSLVSVNAAHNLRQVISLLHERFKILTAVIKKPNAASGNKSWPVE
jgi:hypothetical protein